MGRVARSMPPHLDGFQASEATVGRALGRRGLLQLVLVMTPRRSRSLVRDRDEDLARGGRCALEGARGAAEDLLGHPLIEDLVDLDMGEIVPIIVVTDNGPCSRAAGFARYVASRPEFTHVRTRHRSPSRTA